MSAVPFSKHTSKSISEGCGKIYFIISTLYAVFSIVKATENCTTCLHFLLFLFTKPCTYKSRRLYSLNMADHCSGKSRPI